MLRGFAALAVVVLCVPATFAAGQPRYDYYLTGSGADATAAASGGIMMEGGSTDVDEAFEWMISRATGGDFVVIRASGADGYNQWIYDMGGVDSVETLVLLNRQASYDPFVIETIQNAEMLFIAGGDQSNYVNFWEGTPVEDAIHSVIASGGVIGGTSAGLAVLGEYAFSALNGSAVSSTVLANPYHRTVTIDPDFLSVPLLENTITDSHFAARDRMGRLLVFMARIMCDYGETLVHGIGMDERTALVVEPSGAARVIGDGAVYFLTSTTAPETCGMTRTPLTFRNVSLYKAEMNDTFNLNTRRGSGGMSYSLSVEAGVIYSTQSGGDIY